MLINTVRPFAFTSLLGFAHGPESPAPPLWRMVSDPIGVAALYRHLGEFCHEFRNRLNSLQLCLYLANPDSEDEVGPWGQAEAAYRDVLGQVERLQEICRPMQLDVMRFPLGLLMADFATAWERRFSARGLGLRARPPADDVEGDFDPMRLARGLEAVGAWRLASATPGTEVEIAWGGRGDVMWVEWSESGSGHAAVRRDSGPSGLLALGLAARVVAEQGGRLTIDEGPGLAISLRWPRESVVTQAGEMDRAEMEPVEATVSSGRT